MKGRAINFLSLSSLEATAYSRCLYRKPKTLRSGRAPLHLPI